MSDVPASRRSRSPVVSAAVDGVVLTWVGPAPGVPGDGEIAGDGSARSRALIAEAKRLWADPVQVDHPSFAQPAWTVSGDPRGVIVTLMHLGHGRTVLLEAPAEALRDVFAEPMEVPDVQE